MEILVLLFLFILLLSSLTALVFSLSALYYLLKVKVPYVATPDWAIKYIASQMTFKNGDVVYDLGCGDARLLLELKKKYPDIKAIGYELAWWPYLAARQKIKKSGLAIDLKRENFYNVKLSDATVIFFFLIDSIMPRLEKKLLAELKPGTLVISYGFKFPNWKPKEVVPNPDKPNGSKINIYQR